MPILAAAERRPLAALLLLCAALYLPGLFTLPALDRDEARFAQATKQMLASGDFVVPMFQDEMRAKKPVGIYWLQAASVAAAEALGAGGPEGPGIWAYRIPSVLGAVLASLLTWRLGRLLFGPRAGLLAGAFIACCVALVAEANIAKTDAALAASVVAAQLALARAWLAGGAATGGHVAAPGWGNTVLFWAALAAGILLKGPIAPMIAGLTAAGLVLVARDARWLLRLRPFSGLALLLALTLPWAVAAWVATEGGFFGAAVGGDLLPKLVGGQERHGAPPGYYLLLLPVTFFPASLLLLPGLAEGWRARRDPRHAFLLAWLIPAWLVFELVPTKLPHYVLPLYPALALLGGHVAARALDQPALLKARLFRANGALWAVVALALAVFLVAGPALLPHGLAVDPGPWPVVGAGIFAAMAVQTLAMLWRMRPAAMAVALVATGLVFSVAALELTRPRLEPLWVAGRAERTLEQLGLAGRPVVSAGFSEPSLVFHLGTDTVLTDGGGAARFLAENPQGVALVEERERAAFEAAAAAIGLVPKPVARLEGLNYSRGDRVEITIFVRD